MKEIRFPKAVEKSDKFEKIKHYIGENQKKLWQKAQTRAVFVPASEKLINLFQLEHKRGRLIRGYELVERTLLAQLEGTKSVDARTGVKRGRRLSRLIVVSNDGSERYYRKIDKLAVQFESIVLLFRIDIDSASLGEMFFGPGKIAKVFMLDHKESMANALEALV
ncbi:MAG: hypothetical protein ACQETH_07795 [Candidatus Rifleibacteriota bacterium]